MLLVRVGTLPVVRVTTITHLISLVTLTTLVVTEAVGSGLFIVVEGVTLPAEV